MVNELSVFFEPKSISVVGATEDPHKFGYEVTKNIITSIKGTSTPPQLLLVNPSRDKIFEYQAYPSLLEIPVSPDLVIILVPRKHVFPVIKQACEKHAKGIIIVTAGFAEHDEEGARLQEEIANYALEYGCRIIGPNCVGVINMDVPLNASFVTTPRIGNVALISQSGSMFATLVYQGLPVRYFANIGNQADVTETQVLRHFEENTDVKVIGLYLETVKKGREFYEVLRQSKKPIVVLKTGRTSEGAKSAASHTGSLTTSHNAFLAAIKQSGHIAVNNEKEFIAALTALSTYKPFTKTPKIGLISNAGGPMVTLTDMLAEHKLELATLTDESKAKIQQTLSPLVKPQNPLDIIAHSREKEYYEATRIMLQDPNVDALIVMCVVPTFLGMTPEEHARGVITAIKELNTTKPVIFSWLSGDIAQPGIKLAYENGFIAFESLPETLRAMWALTQSNPRALRKETQ